MKKGMAVVAVMRNLLIVAAHLVVRLNSLRILSHKFSGI